MAISAGQNSDSRASRPSLDRNSDPLEESRSRDTMDTDGHSTSWSDRDQAQQRLDDAKERLHDLAGRGQERGASQLDDFAGAMRRSAHELEESSPQSAHYVHMAADGMHDLSRALSGKNVGELAQSIESFARRRPAAFTGAAVLAGFALARFFRSGAPAGHPIESHGLHRADMRSQSEASRTKPPETAAEASGSQADPGRGATTVVGPGPEATPAEPEASQPSTQPPASGTNQPRRDVDGDIAQ
ncbi:hypothetical protein [Marinivivus vitaminiproducens]|uniref:hypothetical protein n=1 Tax=Marinivivus vitaminiproducens TaxID=3035935 RepID=UPI0027A7396E|nr:hypothetical protein P4R82_23675 [Geminicoccaceae bacterium SCSIO 64248]